LRPRLPADSVPARPDRLSAGAREGVFPEGDPVINSLILFLILKKALTIFFKNDLFKKGFAQAIESRFNCPEKRRNPE